MKMRTIRKVPLRVIQVLDKCSDLCSEASPNQDTDPKSAWARRRSIQHMTPAQLRKFALEAQYLCEWVGGFVYTLVAVTVNIKKKKFKPSKSLLKIING